MKKHLFVETVRSEARKLPTLKAQQAFGLALEITEESIPSDPVQAAVVFVDLVGRLRRDVPAW